MELINLTTELDKKIEEFSARKSRYNLSTLLQKVIAAANQGLKYEVLTQAPHNHTLAEIRGVEAKRNCKPQDFFTTLAGRMVNFPIIGNLARNYYNTNVIDINQQVGIDRSVLEALKSTSMPTTLPEACITCSRG